MCRSLMMVSLSLCLFAHIEGSQALAFKVPQEIPAQTWTSPAAESALHLVRQAYLAAGEESVQLAYVDLPPTVPKSLTAYMAITSNNGPGFEWCHALIVTPDEARLIGTWVRRRSVHTADDPQLTVLERKIEAQKVRQAALIMWHLGYIRRTDVHQEQPKLAGGVFAQFSQSHGHGILTRSGAASGIRYSTSDSTRWTQPRAFGPWYAHILVMRLFSELGEPKTFRAHSPREKPVDAALLSSLLANPKALMPPIQVGHLAQGAGVAGLHEALPALQAWVQSYGGLEKAIQFIWKIHEMDLREKAGASVALARLQEAVDRLTRADDQDYLLQWSTSQRLGYAWAEQRLIALAPEKAVAVAKKQLQRFFIGKTIVKNRRAWEYWHFLNEIDPNVLVEIAYNVPADASYGFGFAAFDLLAAIDDEEAQRRIPALCRAMLREGGQSLEHAKYLQRIVPVEEPMRYRDPAIEAALREVLAKSSGGAFFPTECARAAIYRGHSDLVREVVDATLRRLESRQVVRIGEVAFLADAAFHMPEYREKLIPIIMSSLPPLGDDSWTHRYFYTWALDIRAVKEQRHWSALVGVSRYLDRAWRGETSMERSQALVQLGRYGMLEDQPDRLLDVRWRQQWGREINDLTFTEREELARSLAEIVEDEDIPNHARRLMQDGLRALGK